MFVGWHAATIIANGQPVGPFQMHIDARRMPRHRLIHRIIENLGSQMVQGTIISTTDIHARSVPDRL